MIAAAFLVIALGAALTFAAGHSNVRDFLKKWALGVLFIVGLVAAGAILGNLLNNALVAPQQPAALTGVGRSTGDH